MLIRKIYRYFLLAVIALFMVGSGCAEMLNNSPHSVTPPVTNEEDVLPIVKQYGENDTSIIVSAGGQFEIKLEDNPSTGYTWQDIIFDKSMLELVSEESEAFPGPPAPGRPFWHKYIYKALKAGATQLQMTYKRPWETASEYHKTITYNITIE